MRGTAVAAETELLKNLRPLSQVRRRRITAWTRLCPAGALAIGGLGRSRWRGARGSGLRGRFEVCSSQWQVERRCKYGWWKVRQ